jgi:hypothetical protein
VPGARKTQKAHLWVGIGDADYPYVVFDFTADYTAAGPERFLHGYRGYLQADALAQYEGLYGEDKIRHVCCWAHARRKFVAALEGGEERAQTALAWIGQLYAIEWELRKRPADHVGVGCKCKGSQPTDPQRISRLMICQFMGVTVAALSRYLEKSLPGNQLTVGVETRRCSLNTVLLKRLPLPANRHAADI